MNQLVPIEFQNYKVRVLFDEKGEPWWVARDVCRVLEIRNPHMSIKRLYDDERRAVTISYCTNQASNENDGPEVTDGNLTIAKDKRNREITIISESGLYALVLKSRKPIAREFQRWITRDVIPSIRKTGFYSVYTPKGAKSYSRFYRGNNMLIELDENRRVLKFRIKPDGKRQTMDAKGIQDTEDASIGDFDVRMKRNKTDIVISVMCPRDAEKEELKRKYLYTCRREASSYTLLCELSSHMNTFFNDTSAYRPVDTSMFVTAPKGYNPEVKVMLQEIASGKVPSCNMELPFFSGFKYVDELLIQDYMRRRLLPEE